MIALRTMLANCGRGANLVTMTKVVQNGQLAIPIVADGLAIILSFFLLPALANQLTTPSGSNALIILVGYILFCIGVLLLRKLAAKPDSSDRPVRFTRQGYIVLAVLFGIGMMLFISQQLGYLDLLFTDPYSLGEGQAAAFFVFAPSAWLGVSLFYIPVLAFTVTTTVALNTGRYTIQSLFGLLAVNEMLLLAAAQLKALAGESSLGWFVLSLVLLTIWFGPPRWLYAEKRPNFLSLLTFALLIGWCSWQIIA
jgi:hypothetical protein